MEIINDFFMVYTKEDIINLIDEYGLYNWYFTFNVDNHLDDIYNYIDMLHIKLNRSNGPYI